MKDGEAVFDNATTYLQSLSDLLLGAAVTDAQGARISLDDGTERAVEMLMAARANRRKVMLVGNGGSAAIVSHVHNDLAKALGIRALVFNETPLLTALANDTAYAHVFEVPIEQWAEEGDVLVAVSSSGKSDSILLAAKAAADKGCQIITLSGFREDNPLRERGGVNFYVASDEYGFVETAHAALLHCVTDCALARVTAETASQAMA
jgi:D-sedoheptulose 7-phosphate isomerase